MTTNLNDRDLELRTKLVAVREVLEANGLGGIRLRGVDGFAWATCGGSSVVLLAAEEGVAEVLVTPDDAWVLTDVIERDRLVAEELPRGLRMAAFAWQFPEQREGFVQSQLGGRPLASDRPRGTERSLPEALGGLRRRLLPPERERYRRLALETSEAMTDVLLAARPGWTGFRLAAAGAEALWRRGIEPTLTLVGDERRLPLYRHATASSNVLGARAMLVFCGRRHGLFANLTRFVYFREPTAEERRLHAAAAQVEAAAFSASRPGATLGDVYAAISAAYRDAGHPGAEALHHQGGPCGYLSRDAVARPGMTLALQLHTAVAWNPSLPGAKLEDTALITEGDLALLTVDPRWPTFQVEGRPRPDLLVR